jgi:hypothetical protein
MKTILSIDGGGMKGYVPCAVLVELERRTGKSCSDLFDMVAGTSIGGILACLIATGKSATEALKFFTEDGPVIFGHQQLFGTHGIVKPRYAAGPIEECLKARLGTALLAACSKPLLVPAFDLVAYKPYFFKSTRPDESYQLWQVARATSAAQSYFPAFVLNDMILWDGGNVVNNPAACAVAEAARAYGRTEPLKVLSLCCGASQSVLPPKQLINAGLVKVGLETLGLLFEANDKLPDYVLRQLMPESYFRIAPTFTHNLAIDDASSKALLALQYEASVCIQASSAILDAFINFAGMAECGWPYQTGA